MTSFRLKLTIAYDGTNFHGWATQPGLRCVQSEIENALSILARRPVPLTVGGRTDAGVHARGQVAHCDLTAAEILAVCGKNPVPETAAASAAAASTAAAATIATQTAQAAETAPVNHAEQAAQAARKINGVLKRLDTQDVIITGITLPGNDFDARFGALWRRYEYRIAETITDPLTRNYTAAIGRPVDFALLQQAASQLIGLRDFGAFCKAREGATTIRNLTHFSWREIAPKTWAATIQADAFCHSMVRALVGATVAVATGRITLEKLQQLTDTAARTSGFTVMPAHGLSLEEIAYPLEAATLRERVQKTRARRSLTPDS